MPASPSLRYLIYRPLVSYLSRSKSYHILPASAVNMFPFFRNPDHTPDLHGPGVVQIDPESEHPVNLMAFFRSEGIEVFGDGFGVALDEGLHIALSGLYHLPSCLEALDLLAGTSLLGPQGLHFLLIESLFKAAVEVEVQEALGLYLDVLERLCPVGKLGAVTLLLGGLGGHQLPQTRAHQVGVGEEGADLLENERFKFFSGMVVVVRAAIVS